MKHSLSFPFWVFIFITLFACSDEQDMNTPKPIDELQKKIAEVVPEQNQAILKDLGINFNSGTNPPAISGIFRISPNTLQATTFQEGNQTGHVFPDAGIRFFDQSLENIKVQGVNFIGDEFLSQNAIIVGSVNNFTVFAKGTATKGSNSAIFDVIITGIKDGNSIRNLKAAYTNINNTNGGGQFIPQGTAELVYDAGTASEAIASIDEVNQTDPDENGDDENGDDEDSDKSGVYVVGYQRSRVTNLNIATIWEDGEIKKLDSKDKSGIATGITFLGEDIIISGHIRPTVTSTGSDAVYWKNEELIQLTDDGQSSQALAVLVNGNDLYFVGSYKNSAAVWKNGTVQELPTEGRSSEATGIYVDNGKVYVVGREDHTNRYVGVLWIDGEKSYTSEANRLNFDDVGVLNDEIFIAGSQKHPDLAQHVNRSYAKYWKNGQSNWLLEGPRSSYSRALKIHNNQVYLIYDEEADGFGNNNIFLIKGSEKELIFSDKPSQANAMFIKGNDVYIAGYISYQAAYFKNKTETLLPKFTPTLDYAQSGALGIYVKE